MNNSLYRVRLIVDPLEVTGPDGAAREYFLEKYVDLSFVPHAGMCLEFGVEGDDSYELWTVETVYWRVADGRFDVEVRFYVGLSVLEDWDAAVDPFAANGWTVTPH